MMKIGRAIRTGTALLVVASAVCVTAVSGTVEARSTEAAAHPCANFQLVVRYMSSSGGAGHIGYMFRVHNILPGACTLYGYPGAMELDRNFNSLPTHVTRGMAYLTGKRAPVTVTLQGGHDGYFVLEWDHIPSPGQTCPTSSYVMITPPNDRLPVVTFAKIDACGGNIIATPVARTAFSF
jgi:hypothetical protein